ncbi:hypothetical protein TNCV_4331711 [Trichonephila clavipes]|nr:hypothetical protein TNCV_4331711 [Trichonephila clavipes]
MLLPSYIVFLRHADFVARVKYQSYVCGQSGREPPLHSDGNTERRIHRPPISSSLEDRHSTRMILPAATSHLSQKLEQQHRFSVQRPWIRLPFTLHYRQERLQCELQPLALPFIRAPRNPTSQQGFVQPQVAGIVWDFLGTENVQPLHWPARSPDLSPRENVWSMVTEWRARHHMTVTVVEELWLRVEDTWTTVTVHAIQSLFQ